MTQSGHCVRAQQSSPSRSAQNANAYLLEHNWRRTALRRIIGTKRGHHQNSLHSSVVDACGCSSWCFCNPGSSCAGQATYLFVTEIDVRNPEAYGKEFTPKAQATIKAAGGHQIAIRGAGGAGAKEIMPIDGAPPKRVVIQQWDSIDALKAWYNGAAYQETLKIGKQYATFRRYAIEGKE